uniref:Hyaluronan/mRNA-binding protein domain-containing protein n=1 Tax=Aegilops tauschii subsp. strangulata TaxID=200361 RepID=A0A453A3F7_AEGTS
MGLPMRASISVAHGVMRFAAAAEDARGSRGDGAGRGRGGRGGGFGRTGPRRDYGDADANGGFEGGYGGGGGGGYAAPRLEDGDGKQAERGRGPRQPYRGGGGRRGGYSDGQNTDEFGRPHRSYERRSGTGRGFGMKRDGAGRGNWGTATDEGFPQENVEAVNTEETPAVTEDEKKPEDAPQPEAEKVKEGAENEEDQKEAEEDKEMTLEEYEKVLEEKRKAILALKAEERKVEVDKELQSMQQLSVKKDAEEVFIKLVSYTCCGPSSACGYIDANFYPTPCCRALTRRRRKKTQKERSVPRSPSASTNS